MLRHSPLFLISALLASGCSPFADRDHAIKEQIFLVCPEITPTVECPEWPEHEPLFEAKLRYNICEDALETVLESIENCRDRH